MKFSQILKDFFFKLAVCLLAAAVVGVITEGKITAESIFKYAVPSICAAVVISLIIRRRPFRKKP
jgi:hypothetical protein